MTQEQIVGLGFIEPEELRERVLSLFYGLMEAPWSEVIAVVDQVSRSGTASPARQKNSATLSEVQAPSLTSTPSLASNSSPFAVERGHVGTTASSTGAVVNVQPSEGSSTMPTGFHVETTPPSAVPTSETPKDHPLDLSSHEGSPTECYLFLAM